MKLVPIKDPVYALTPQEQKQAQKYVNNIIEYVDRAEEIWEQLRKLHDDRMYYQYAKSWEEFLKKAFGNRLSRQAANNMLLAAAGMSTVKGLTVDVTPSDGGGARKAALRDTPPQELKVGVDIEVQQKAAIELGKVEGDAAKADIMTKAVQDYSKRNKDGEVVVTATAIKKAAEATSVTPPVDMGDCEDDEEEYEDQDIDEFAKEMASEIESVCRSVLKAFKDGLKNMSATARTYSQSKGMDDASEAAIKKALATLRRTKPVLCPVCSGDGCQHCEDDGIVTADKASSLKGVTE